jgi:hypothetical protein
MKNARLCKNTRSLKEKKKKKIEEGRGVPDARPSGVLSAWTLASCPKRPSRRWGGGARLDRPSAVLPKVLRGRGKARHGRSCTHTCREQQVADHSQRHAHCLSVRRGGASQCSAASVTHALRCCARGPTGSSKNKKKVQSSALHTSPAARKLHPPSPLFLRS